MLTEQELNMIQAREKRFDYVEVGMWKQKALDFVTMKKTRKKAGEFVEKLKKKVGRKKPKTVRKMLGL